MHSFRAPTPFDHTALLQWYYANRREMPWRNHPDSYTVWISEIMLQQTQVDTVRPYFDRFILRFPTLQSLAEAPLEDVLSHWQGLGYYARARHLHAAARQLVIAATTLAIPPALPTSAQALSKLPGIGDYTAAAIASICFHERTPVVDGNVARVFARYYQLSDNFKTLPPRRALASQLQGAFDRTPNPGDLNQAMMELGALVCRPAHPDCSHCPLASTCQAFQTHTVEAFPKRTASPQLPTRHAFGIFLQHQNHVLMAQRPENGLLGGLWELPGEFITQSRPTRSKVQAFLQTQTGISLAAKNFRSQLTLQQSFSHFHLHLHVFVATHSTSLDLSSLPVPASTLRWISLHDLPALPIATAHRRALNSLLKSTENSTRYPHPGASPNP